MKCHAGEFEAYGEEYGAGDAIICCLDLDAGMVSYSKNGVPFGPAHQLPPNAPSLTWYPHVCLKNCAVDLAVRGTGFMWPVPQGYTGIGDAPPAQRVAAADAACGTGAGRGPMALILEPARDLAEQVYEEVLAFTQHLTSPPLTCALLLGGVSPREQKAILAKGVDVVVGSPGRVEDAVDRGQLVVAGVRHFVLDEADRFTETENLALVTKLYGRLPKGGDGDGRLQVCLFSATLHSDGVSELAGRVCLNPTWVDLKGKDHVPDSVHHVVVVADPAHAALPGARRKAAKLAALPPVLTDAVHRGGDVERKTALPPGDKDASSEALKRLKPQLLIELIDAFAMSQCLIFCRTNLDCDLLERFLVAAGGGSSFRGRVEKGKEGLYSCCVLAGMRSMDERRANLEAFKEGDVRLLVCTDVAARGIDIKGLPYVVNMTLPDPDENYIHRIGRVGRAECVGLAISIVAAPRVRERVWYCQKSKKPPQKDTRDYAKGGNCLWYDEPGLLKKIEQRLGGETIAVVTPETGFALPEGMKVGVEYGAVGGGRPAEQLESAKHAGWLTTRVSELQEVEKAAQDSYLKLVAGGAGKGRAGFR